MSEIYKAITAVQAALAKTGIAKDRNNQAQGYKFRGIDDVYNALAPVLAENGLCILPRILSREMTIQPTKNGGSMFYVVVEAEFDFVAAKDGSSHTVRTFGEAMDSADKATNKAMSAAYKYAAFQAFAIPTEGDNDADAHTPHVVPTAPEKPAEPSKFLSEFQMKKLFATIKEHQVDIALLKQQFGFESSKEILAKDFNAILKWIVENTNTDKGAINE